MYRTRTKPGSPLSVINIGEVGWTGDWATPGLPVNDTWIATPTPYSLPNGYKDLKEDMNDIQGNDEGYKREKSCFHLTETNEFSAALIPYLSSNGRTNWPMLRVTDSMIQLQHAHIAGTVSQPDWDLLRRKAINTMRPHLKSATSVINFVLELKDLKSWGKVGNALQRIRGMAKPSKLNIGRKARKEWAESLPYSDLSYRMPKGRIKMLKDIVRRLAGAHLQASFGVVPFISDLVETFVGLSEMQYKLQALKRYAGRRQARHYKYVLPPADDPTGSLGNQWHHRDAQVFSWVPPFDSDFRPSPVYYRKWRWVKVPVYHAKMVYKYTLPRVSEAEADVAVFFDTLGLKLDPSIIWNAIPFSFVVDWVVDVSSFLKSFSRDNFPITTTVEDFSESVSYHYETEISIQGVYKDKSLFFPTAHLFEQTYGKEWSMGTVYRGMISSYDRRTPSVSLDSHAISIKTPGSREGFLSGSLFTSIGLGDRRKYRSH
jgi:hypothetical protein